MGNVCSVLKKRKKKKRRRRRRRRRRRQYLVAQHNTSQKNTTHSYTGAAAMCCNEQDKQCGGESRCEGVCVLFFAQVYFMKIVLKMKTWKREFTLPFVFKCFVNVLMYLARRWRE